MNRAEFMLLYVACTRAKQKLDNSAVSWINDWLEPAGEAQHELTTADIDGHTHNVTDETNGRTIPKGRRKRKQRPQRAA
jgi:ATP-dependent exoDNAse (exonuclease V) beta subunit